MSAQVAADLRAAADVLERDGWTQGDYISDDGCGRCAMGAVLAVISRKAACPADLPMDDELRFREDVEVLFRSLGFDYGLHLVDWNDTPGRSADEVIAALRTAADRAEAEA